jgi:anti-anti-sigma factor
MAPTFSSESQGDDSTIRMAGEIDVGAVDDLAEVLESFVGARHRIVLEMSQVSAFDAAALHVIAEAAEWARSERGSLVIHDPSAAVRAVLEEHGALDLLAARPDGS